MKYTILLVAALSLSAQDADRITRMLDGKLNVSQRNDACMELRGVKSRKVVDAMFRALEARRCWPARPAICAKPARSRS